MNRKKIVVLGRNYTSILGMVRAMKNKEFEIIVIRCVRNIPSEKSIRVFLKKLLFGRSIEANSKYIKKYLYTTELNREELIEKLLTEFSKEKEKVILLPTDDFTASTIDLYQEKLSSKFLYPNIKRQKGEIVKLMNKEFQKELSEKSGLNVAKGYSIRFIDKKYKLPNNIVYPVFTKPQISFKGDKTLMKKCDNEKQLRELLDFVAQKYDCPILIEQYIDIENEYAVLGCSYDNNIIMPGMIRMLKSGSGSHKGVTLMGEITNFNKDGKYGKLYEELEKFIKTLSFNGLFDIDLYESQGKFYFNELNLRFGASGYAITNSGVNLPRLFVDKLLNRKNKETIELESKKFINEKVNLEDYEAGYISWKEYKKLNSEADFGFIKSKEDFKPYLRFKRKETFIHIKKIIKKS